MVREPDVPVVRIYPLKYQLQEQGHWGRLNFQALLDRESTVLTVPVNLAKVHTNVPIHPANHYQAQDSGKAISFSPSQFPIFCHMLALLRIGATQRLAQHDPQDAERLHPRMAE